MKGRTMAGLVAAVAVLTLAGTGAAQAGVSPMLKFKLPFAGTVNTTKTGFKITNAGSGNGLEGDATGSGNGVYGSSTSGNAGVWGTNTGSGIGTYGGAGSGGLAGVYGIAAGNVTGVWGTSASGDGVRRIDGRLGERRRGHVARRQRRVRHVHHQLRRGGGELERLCGRLRHLRTQRRLRRDQLGQRLRGVRGEQRHRIRRRGP